MECSDSLSEHILLQKYKSSKIVSHVLSHKYSYKIIILLQLNHNHKNGGYFSIKCTLRLNFLGRNALKKNSN